MTVIEPTGRRRAGGHRAEHRPDRPTAGGAGITLLELSAQQASLEEAFMDLTQDAVEYHGATTTDGGSALDDRRSDR